MSEEKEKKKSLLEIELARAIAAGKAPEFEVVSFDFHNMFWQMGGANDKRIQVVLSVLLGGQQIPIVVEQSVQQEKSDIAYAGRLGSVDLMERALRDAIARRWPKMDRHLQEVKTTDYAVHAIGNEDSHHVQVHLNVVLGHGEKRYSLSCEGVDIISLTLEALVTIYHWVTWRLERRLRGEERNRSRPA